jgi:hypothetical protein
MVSSPVADLLVPKINDRYIEYKNAAGDTLRFKIFAKDGVKMISLNGIELYLDELFDIIQDVEESDVKQEKESDMLLPFALGMLISFIAIMLYMRYVFLIAF